ncbi:hypothetical protein [Nocardioides sp. zg-DK7169]|uniref:hypothetical protein n=1 Tax=Nocardioides sp. zg-DK7169 TaxID=2736600 RepID=UPI0015537C36|nr:hypothetical protein [Nocardioides sp. zg-DK7169]NPC97301.1 hypothetical protein [Nocardioides sp. zg-DK7169]
MTDDHLIISVETVEASDSWGFVGVVRVGGIEAYRTIRRYSSPSAAHTAAVQLLVNTVGILLAGQEWRGAAEEFGHPPHRVELGFGLGLDRQPQEGHATGPGA